MKILIRLLIACSIFIISACSEQSSIPDSLGKERYIIIGSYIAEIMVALDGVDRIVGVSSGTEHITELANIPIIPGYRNTSAEAMLSLAPTHAFLAGQQTRPEVAAQLAAAGVKVHFFEDNIATLDVVSDRIYEIGVILNRQKEAEILDKKFEVELAEAIEYAQKATSRPKGLFILSGGGRPTVVAGGDTHIALLLKLARAENMTDEISYFKPMSQEAMIEAAPDFIMVNKEGLEISGGIPVALKAPGALLTPAGKSNNVFALPSGHLQGLGLNSPKAIKAIAQKTHPELNVNN